MSEYYPPGQPLPPQALYRRSTVANFSFQTTEELSDWEGLLGQDRAVAAVHFAIAMPYPGYNLYVLGPAGYGKHTLVHHVLEKQAASQSAPADWCYVHDFRHPRRPQALRLPPGRGAQLQRHLARFIKDIPALGLDRAMAAVQENYRDVPAIGAYLEQLEQDLLASRDSFSNPQVKEQALSRYRVNVLVSHEPDGGAPLIYEPHPTPANLLGRVEYRSHQGTWETDFTLIKPGALHRANGGYLILEATSLLAQPVAWEGLKRALGTRQIPLDPPNTLESSPAVSLSPEAIPLDVKVVLVGERDLYYRLHQQDPDFAELFKVMADFADELPRTAESENHYARLLATLVRRDGLRPLDRQAVGRVIEQAARWAEDQELLSLHLEGIRDLLREAHWWGGQAQRHIVTSQDIQQALDAQLQRTDRVPQQIQQEMARGLLRIDTMGKRVGQVNGLSVLQVGTRTFGQPSRITATVHSGEGRIVDIEREVELGGALHTKGVLILSAFLGTRYGQQRPLSLAASLVFEQSYGEVDGDSASLAELCALLSALADVPLDQSLAVTGAVDQHGSIQPIGGINEKVEGFFQLCQSRNLTGGVIIPGGNVRHLMLQADLVAAVAADHFRVYPVTTVDQAMTLLTGLVTGERDASGSYPVGTVNYRAEQRLRRYGELKLPLSRPTPLLRRPLPQE